jgi:hypothetical protein
MSINELRDSYLKERESLKRIKEIQKTEKLKQDLREQNIDSYKIDVEQSTEECFESLLQKELAKYTESSHVL